MLCVLLIVLIFAPQQVPVDTSVSAPQVEVQGDTLTDAPAETLRIALDADAGALVPDSVTAPPQDGVSDTVSADTLDTLRSAPYDTATAANVPPAPPVRDTLRAAERTDRVSEIDQLLEGMGREVEQFQEGMARQVDQLLGTFTLTRFFLLILLVAFAYLAIRFSMTLLAELAAWRPAWRPWLRKALPFVRFGLWLFALWIIVGTLFGGSTLLFVLTVVLVLGAVVFALFQFMRDLMGGLVLLVEQPFQIGSRVRIGEQVGQVVRIGLRSFKLETPEGASVVIPNAEVLRRAVRSTSAETADSRVCVTLAFPDALPVDEASRLAREAAYTSPYIYVQKPVTARLDDSGAGPARRLAVTAHVFDDQHADALASDIRRIAADAFERNATRQG